MSGKPAGYKEVSERIQDFRAKHPEGSLQSEVVPSPIDGFIIVKAYAYRTPDDPTPGVGLAWEPVPGKTNFTRDSELMNAETSAWGRAIIAVGASDAKEGISSANEIRNRQVNTGPAKPTSRPADDSPPFDAPGSITDDQMGELSRLLGLVDAETATKQILANTGRDSLEELSSSDADKSIAWLAQADAA